MRRSLIPILAAILVIAACGGGDKTTKKEETATTDPGPICEPQECLIEGMARESGIKRGPGTKDPTPYYELACEGGALAGCYNLGVMYFNGKGISKDVEKARTFYEKGCDGGHGPSCANLGYLYSTGAGVEKDLDRARKLYEQACEAGAVFGCNNLADMYQTGRGVEKEMKRAEELFEKACFGGVSSACIRRAWLHGQKCLEGSNECTDEARDEKEAAQKVGAVCEAGGPSVTCVAWGVHLRSGRLVTKDAKASREWLEAACEKGDVWGCTEYGMSLAAGKGGAAQPEKAMPFFKKACEEDGFVAACNLAAVLYTEGRGVERDPDRGAGFMATACELGAEDACNTLLMLCQKGHESACQHVAEE